MQEQYGAILEHIAVTAALNISGNEHATILKAGDENNDAFGNIKKCLELVQQKNYLEIDAIYTFQVTPRLELTFGVMLADLPFVGHSYTLKSKILRKT